MSHAMIALRATAPKGTTLTLHNDDPCKGWLLEIHGEDVDSDEEDLAIVTYIARFKTLGLKHLGEPGYRDMRIRLQGDSSHWTMFEFTSLDEAGREQAVARLAAALAQA